MLSLDLKDRKILYELDKNARITCAQIGKQVGLSTEVVNYRVKKLEEKGIIINYHTAVDYFKLDLIHFKVCLKFNGISLQIEEELYNQLKQISQIIWIAKTQGEWGSLISCTVNNINEFDQIKDKILSLANPHIANKSISILSDLWSYPRNYLINEKIIEFSGVNKVSSFINNKKKETKFEIKKDKVKIDDTDLQLLRILSDDARKSVVDIVEEMKSTVKIITTRIRRLIKSGIIKNFRLVLDYDKLGIHFYKTFIYLKNPDEKRLKQLLGKLNVHPNVIHNLKVIGDWDLEPEFEFENKDDFQKTIQSLMDEFSDIIQRISVINILKEYKYTFFYK